jgi:iron complex transport system substrate-binding protein
LFSRRGAEEDGALKNIDQITGDVLDVSIRIHRELGPGLLESVYETVLAAKLTGLGHKVDRQKAIDIEFEGLRFEAAFRVDILVDEQLIVEIKSIERLNATHSKQLLTYLRLMNLPVGLLINFAGATLREGFKRLVNNYDASASLRLCAK